MDKEIIIKGCENWVNNHKGESLPLRYSSVVELLAVLKEQEEEIYKLQKELYYWQNKGRSVKWE